MGQFFWWVGKHRGSVSQQLWHDNYFSLFKGHKRWLKAAILQPFIAHGDVSLWMKFQLNGTLKTLSELCICILNRQCDAIFVIYSLYMHQAMSILWKLIKITRRISSLHSNMWREIMLVLYVYDFIPDFKK